MKSRKVWDKTTLTWMKRQSCRQRETSVIVSSGILDPEALNISGSVKSEKYVHKLEQLMAWSLPHEPNGERCGELVFDLSAWNGKQNCAPHKNITTLVQESLDLLEKPPPKTIRKFRSAPRVFPPQTDSWTDKTFKVHIRMSDGEQFCDSAIRTARAVVEALGIHDPSTIFLSDFELSRESFILFRGNWIPYADKLR
jgi:hypothetical protein